MSEEERNKHDFTKDILNAEEVAALLGIQPLTVKEWARNGKIPAAKVGKQWLFSRRKLVEWIEEGGEK
ncbi:helix-turn-helix domain-containing protein [Fictibacillus sp. 23RED33]|uniref:helix-turn-helix domain-containing protein n=1 Tax=Fictibacillus sp. 23RED33 TaxID=2745879 RepID=UPI0018CD1BC3|nr:helix-turn-helix domain-containing protein [Fictibacillus sp. 23RED33]